MNEKQDCSINLSNDFMARPDEDRRKVSGFHEHQFYDINCPLISEASTENSDQDLLCNIRCYLLINDGVLH